MSSVAPAQRFTKHHPCPICGGHNGLPSGRGYRCYGYLSSDEQYAHCSRDERALGLPQEAGGTYAHRLDGLCRCGETHGTAPVAVNGSRAESTPARVYRDYRDAGAVRAYDYSDQTGALLFQVWRYANPKRFKQARPVPGGWSLGIGGVRRVLYRLPDLLAADRDAWVCLCEGEKDADTVTALGMLGTTNPMGAKVWAEEFTRTLAGRRVAILEDNDTDGRAGAVKKATALTGIAREVRVVAFSDLPAGGDFSDWAAAGGTAEQLAALIEAAPVWGSQPAPSRRHVQFITAREFAEQTPDTVPWIIEPWVAAGAITKIDGLSKKAGKTTLICHMVAAVLDGTDFLGYPTRQGPVIFLSEQGSTSLRQAMAKAGLLQRDDMHLALYRALAGIPWPEVVEDTFALAAQIGAVLLVTDTLPAVSGVRGEDENSSGRALESVTPVQIGADTHQVGVIASFHDRKSGGEVGESGRGSSAYAGAVDAILRLSKPGGKGRATTRKIEGLSRFDATPDELYVDLTPTGYVPLGSEADVVAAAVGRALGDVLPSSEAEAKPVGDVTKNKIVISRGLVSDLNDRGVSAGRSTIDAELKRWVEGGFAGQRGGGKRGNPFCFWLIARPPFSFFQSKRDEALEESNDDASEDDDGGEW